MPGQSSRKSPGGQQEHGKRRPRMSSTSSGPTKANSRSYSVVQNSHPRSVSTSSDVFNATPTKRLSLIQPPVTEGPGSLSFSSKSRLMSSLDHQSAVDVLDNETFTQSGYQSPSSHASTMPRSLALLEMGPPLMETSESAIDLAIPEELAPEKEPSIASSSAGSGPQTVTFGEACFQCMKKSVAFSFSSAILVTLVVAYLIMGAYIFEKIESGYENEIRDEVRKNRLRLVKELWDLTRNMGELEVNLTEITISAEEDPASGRANSVPSVYELLQKLESYEKGLLKLLGVSDFNLPLHANSSGNGTNNKLDRGKWCFESAILYATTVITTIGYGNMVPKTDGGRIMTMAYALFGIPLMLITLTHIGQLLASIFRFVYNHGCIVILRSMMRCFCACCWRQRPKKKRTTTTTHKDSTLGKRAHSHSTLDGSRTGETAGTQWATTPEGGLVMSSSGATTTTVSVMNTSQQNKKSTNSGYNRGRHLHSSKHRKKTRKQESIPTLVILGVVIMYLVGVAMLFKYWSTWSWLEAIYFCFITFSTIGFGDYVPGHETLMNTEDTYQTIVCALAVLFGLALVSMAFNLMLDNLTHTTKSCCNCCKRKRRRSDTPEMEETASLMLANRGQPMTSLTYKNPSLMMTVDVPVA